MQVDLQKTKQAWQECCQHYVMTCILLPSAHCLHPLRNT